MQPIYIQHTASIHPQGNLENHPFLSACEPNYKEIITNAVLRRRMSRIIKMGVACGLECIADIAPQKIQGIITATGLGCLTDTEKFLNTLIDNKERMLNPTPFIQSTFNTIGAQIALLLQIHAYNMTYVHRGLSFESALLDAMMKIEEGSENILVGAVDEITDSSYTIQRRLGLYKGIQAGEGAQFFLLSRTADSHPLAEIRGVETYTGKQTTEETINRISRFLQRHGLETQNIHWLVTGKTRPTDETDTETIEKHGLPPQNGIIKEENTIYKKLETELFPNSLSLSFKDECGEYPTASSYAIWKVIKELDQCKKAVNILIYNHHHSINHSLMLIRKSV